MEHRTKYSKLKDIIRLNNFFTLDMLVDILQGFFFPFFTLLFYKALWGLFIRKTFTEISYIQSTIIFEERVGAGSMLTPG